MRALSSLASAPGLSPRHLVSLVTRKRLVFEARGGEEMHGLAAWALRWHSSGCSSGGEGLVSYRKGGLLDLRGGGERWRMRVRSTGIIY